MLDNIVNKYNNKVHRTIKMKPVNVTDDPFVEYNEDSNKRNLQFKVGDHVRISKYKNILVKDMLLIGQKKFLLLIELKIQFLGLLLLMI